MKRYLIPILVGITVLALGVLIGCNNDYEQRLARLEQQTQELSSENRLEPRVIEKDIESPNHYQLPFSLKVGDRVEGEVSITHSSKGYLYGGVKDPYGNILVETRDGEPRPMLQRFVGSPWRFAFIAATDGEYTLEVSYSPDRVEEQPVAPVAHLKVVCYPDD